MFSLYSSVVEVDDAERSDPMLGYQAALQPENVGGVVWEFICARRAFDLIGRVEIVDTAARATSAKAVFQKERDCDKWCLYEIGFSPKDHLMEVRQRQFEEATRRLNGLQIAVTIIATALATLLAVAAVPGDSFLGKLLFRPAPMQAPPPLPSGSE
jgi:hypothetical protein